MDTQHLQQALQSIGASAGEALTETVGGLLATAQAQHGEQSAAVLRIAVSYEMALANLYRLAKLAATAGQLPRELLQMIEAGAKGSRMSGADLTMELVQLAANLSPAIKSEDDAGNFGRLAVSILQRPQQVIDRAEADAIAAVKAARGSEEG